MGQHDRRHSPKMKQRKRQTKFKERQARKKTAAKAAKSG
jgi:hypothetical protein